jgi:hypothetical protein
MLLIRELISGYAFVRNLLNLSAHHIEKPWSKFGDIARATEK